MFKKIIIASLVIGSLAVGSLAFAELIITSPSPTSMPVQANNNMPAMVVHVEQNGKALIRGTVVGTPTSSALTLKTWDGNWTVNISSSTKLIPNDITQFHEGDFVGTEGMASSTTPLTLDAKLVVDKAPMRALQANGGEHGMPNKPEGQKPPMAGQGQGNIQQIEQQIAQILEEIKKLQAGQTTSTTPVQ